VRTRLDQLREQWYWHQSKLEGDADAEEKLLYTKTAIDEEKRHELEMEIADLMRRWQVRSTPLLAPSEATSLFSASADEFLARVQAHLRPQELLLHYYLVEGQFQALLVTPSDIHLVRELVSVERLKGIYEKWQSDLEQHFPFAASPQSDVKRAKRHLYRFHKALVAPLTNHLASCEHIFLVMPPEWHDLPVSAFFDRQSYLAQRYQLTYLSAPEVLLREESSSFVTPSASESLATPAGAVVVGYSNKGDVPHTLDEARQVAGMLAPHLPTTLLLEHEATFARLHSASQNCRLLHLASHAIFRPDNPLFSWVRLADTHLKVVDLYDQISLPHHPLVVLSACETGRGKARGGGLLGMARGFMAAGANGLIVSLWKAPDQSSAQLMADFYPHLLQPTTTAPAALHHAQQQAMARDYHPYHWAGFIAIRG
jgi:CHAT domain-containing protein